jgi:hypothetical protein
MKGNENVRITVWYTIVLIVIVCLNRPFDVAFTILYPKVSGLAAWSENCKWYISLWRET